LRDYPSISGNAQRKALISGVAERLLPSLLGEVLAAGKERGEHGGRSLNRSVASVAGVFCPYLLHPFNGPPRGTKPIFSATFARKLQFASADLYPHFITSGSAKLVRFDPGNSQNV